MSLAKESYAATEEPPHSAAVFSPISGARAFEEVIEQVLYAVRSGLLPIGTKLPNVDEMASLMTVSKPTVGQALKSLSDAGVISVSRGVNGGAVVLSNAPPREKLVNIGRFQSFTLIEMLELRGPVEIEIALLASKNLKLEIIEALQNSIHGLENYINDDFWTAVYYDHAFHYILGRSSGSGALAYVQHSILERIYYEMASNKSLRETSVFDSNIKWHRATLDAVVSRDEEKIRNVMAQHLQPFYRDVVRIQKKANYHANSSK